MSRRRSLTAAVIAALVLTTIGAPAVGQPSRHSAGADVGSGQRPSAERPVAGPRGEIWALDQGTDLVHVHRADTHEEIARLDLSPAALRAAGFDAAPTGPSTVPHMIEFDSRERFAFIAATAGGVTIVVDAVTKRVVEVLATGPGTHMAAVTPDDRAVWVAVIGTPGRVANRSQTLVEIPLDLRGRGVPRFEIGRVLALQDLLAPVEARTGWTFPSFSPVCHQYGVDGREAWLTLGPGWNQGALVVVDLRTGTLSHAYDPAEVRANCGVAVTRDRVVANWSGRVVEGQDTEGEWYVFDARTKEHLQTRPSGGFDAHGVRLSPDGRTYWMLNRNSDNALQVDARTLEVRRVVDGIAATPDILDYSRDGRRLYISQRGPTPRSGAAHSATGPEPGVLVADAVTGARIALLAPPEVRDTAGRVLNDVHGLAFRSRIDDPGATRPGRARFDQRPTVVPAQAGRGHLGFHCSLPAA